MNTGKISGLNYAWPDKRCDGTVNIVICREISRSHWQLSSEYMNIKSGEKKNSDRYAKICWARVAGRNVNQDVSRIAIRNRKSTENFGGIAETEDTTKKRLLLILLMYLIYFGITFDWNPKWNALTINKKILFFRSPNPGYWVINSLIAWGRGNVFVAESTEGNKDNIT